MTGRKPEGAPERSPKAGAGTPSGVDRNGPKRFSVQRKMAIVARLLRGEPLELVARETNVSIARLSEWRERALAGAATALDGIAAKAATSVTLICGAAVRVVPARDYHRAHRGLCVVQRRAEAVAGQRAISVRSDRSRSFWCPAPAADRRSFTTFPHWQRCIAPAFRAAQSGLQSPQVAQERRSSMTNGSSLSLAELEQRIAIARDNIRQLIEQAAALSGAEDEDRNADRIAQQQEELDRLIKQRELLLKK